MEKFNERITPFMDDSNIKLLYYWFLCLLSYSERMERSNELWIVYYTNCLLYLLLWVNIMIIEKLMFSVGSFILIYQLINLYV